MKQTLSIRLMAWLASMYALLLPLNCFAAESAKAALSASAIDMMLPIHQQKKLHPEFSDPVLGDQAQIVEWAWSPQYAERFNQPVQPDGLKDGALWLIGIKVQRKQSKGLQSYQCSIIGLMDNKLQIITPPGEQHMIHPGYIWNGLPVAGNMGEGFKEYSPGLQTWYKKPANKRQEKYPENSDGFTQYINFYRNFQPGIAYFEINVGCAYLGNPEKVRTEIRFPTKVDGKNDDDPKVAAVFESSAIKFDIPDSLMQKMYPYTQDAYDWGQCLMRRSGGQTYLLSDHALKTKRFGNTCEPAVATQKNH